MSRASLPHPHRQATTQASKTSYEEIAGVASEKEWILRLPLDRHCHLRMALNLSSSEVLLSGQHIHSLSDITDHERTGWWHTDRICTVLT